MIDQIGHSMDRQILGFLRKRHAAVEFVEIDAHPIAATNLIRRNQIGHWLHQQPLNRALQVTCAVLQIRTLSQQLPFRSVCSLEDERSVSRRIKNTLLYLVQLDVENPGQFVGS